MSTSVQGIPAIEGIVKRLAATDAQVAVAMRQAIRKTSVWAGNQGRSGISESLNLRLAALKGRVGVYIRMDDPIGKTWFGLNPLASSRLNPRPTQTGATMEGMKGEVKGAFVARAKKNGLKFMWKREGKSRLPIAPVRLPIHDVGQAVIERDVFPKVEDRFLYEFERELQRLAIKP